ncbi:MAG TPA: hypothetical protein VE998_11010 [Terriglobales bacterium]|nr:hypothetical protein [Terriglobales bacterium]
MKLAIRILALSALLAATAQAALPKTTVKVGFGGGPVPLCDPYVEKNCHLF